MHQIDAVVDMIDIVSLDLKSETMSITVEPLVTTGQLTGALLHLGYTLPVVPEMDDLTVGGLVNGTGIESSSHLEGLFHEQ
ncbi:MAG: FAD-binding oxidoreductase, partial [Chitinophagia bacterium]|nr:FAD-binding oxidoreductase [Chitinophagia bacterium]